MNKREAFYLLSELSAPKRLTQHVVLVGEVAEDVLEFIRDLDVDVDEEFVRTGVVLHDIGKVVHPEELRKKGNLHLEAGRELLEKQGLDAKLARVCVSHAEFATMECSLEEYIIALSDKLWKGVRIEELEMKIIDLLAEKLKKDRMDVYIEIDTFFEKITEGTDERMTRSRRYL